MSHEHRIISSQTNGSSVPLPPPRAAVSIRAGTLDDLAFIDALQRRHTKQVGWMPTMQLEGKIRAGHVLVAEEAGEMLNDECRRMNEEQPGAGSSEFTIHPSSFSIPPTPVGYCMGNDQYFKRDDVGIIYQMNVVPGRQRGLVGATLLKAQFERSAWGCKLYCCWCAQDIEANRFWESMGFVALAFRTGSRGRGPNGAGRIHIFWQRRIRNGDETTPYWFPSQTSSGAVREDRLVLPIPPGTHWSDAKPLILPGVNDQAEAKALPAPRKRREQKAAVAVVPASAIVGGGLRFAPIAPVAPVAPVETAIEKPAREKRKAEKNDPRLVAAARELRDRWMEHANAHPEALLANGKYDVSRQISDMRTGSMEIVTDAPALPAPMAA